MYCQYCQNAFKIFISVATKLSHHPLSSSCAGEAVPGGLAADGRVPGEGEAELGQLEAAPPQLEAVVTQEPAEHETVSLSGHQRSCAEIASSKPNNKQNMNQPTSSIQIA